MKRLLVLCCSCIVGLLLTGCNNSSQVELYVPTAASMTDVMEELIELYNEENPNVSLVPTYGGSGQLKDQIIQGAPADVFLSAALSWMEELDQEGLVVEFEEAFLNQLVLVKSIHSDYDLHSIADLTNDEVNRIAIGDPESVPAGTYAKQALEALDLYEVLSSKIMFANDVRTVLTYVETENVDAGFVYQTDAKSNDRVEIIAVAEGHASAVYPIGLMENSDHPEEAKELYDWLSSEQVGEVFASYGFEVN